MSRLRCTDRGFSLLELLVVVALLGTLVAVAVPVMHDVSASIKLGEAARQVERQLQSARLKAVNVNRPLRVRTNCPAAGYIRTVEWVGSAAIDDAENRCMVSAYPYPAADSDVTTTPNHDGPLVTLPAGATVTSANVQFNPDGTTSQVVDGVVTAVPTTGLTVTVTREGKDKQVTINAAGKVVVQ